MEYKTEISILAIAQILEMLNRQLLTYKGEAEKENNPLSQETWAALIASSEQTIYRIERIVIEQGVLAQRHIEQLAAISESLHRNQEAREKAIAAYEQSLG